MENYIHCFSKENSENMWEITYTIKWNNGDIIWKSIHCLLNVQWYHMFNAYSLFSVKVLTKFMETHPLVIKCAVIKYWKQHLLLFEREQWQYMEIHSLLNKYAVTTKGKLNLLLFERELSKHMENHIHYLLKQQWQHMDIHPLLIKCAVTTHEKPSPTFWKRGETKCRKLHPVLSNTAVTTFTEIHPLLTKYARSVKRKLNVLLFQREQWEHVKNYCDNIWKSIYCLINMQWQ